MRLSLVQEVKWLNEAASSTMKPLLNFRSDTQTLPTIEMLDAIRDAPLGDDTYDEDPTVTRLEELAAKMLGKEAALLVISGTMGNLCALMAHASPGDEVLLDAQSHIYAYEAGGIANVAGLMPLALSSHKGILDPDELQTAIRPPNLHHPTPRLLCLENTHNLSGGRVVPLRIQNRLCEVAHDHGLAVHLDGARIFNAAIKQGVPAAAVAQHADSIMFCLSKGLSCPLGSLLVGSREFIAKADHCRKRVGGGMRQAGIIAACGIVALENLIDRLADDHSHARVLAESVHAVPGLRVDLESVETNMVNVDHSDTGLTTPEILKRFQAAGLLASGRPPRQFRLVTNRHHDRAAVEEAVTRIRTALSA
ncbi:MAG TPA: GntG family PLP-dependent aldolase [Planctomycetaceae bacterium]|nr:GntG family PLP-dependent aldolase [Planctomycetaceae bacterium]